MDSEYIDKCMINHRHIEDIVDRYFENMIDEALDYHSAEPQTNYYDREEEIKKLIRDIICEYLEDYFKEGEE